MAWRAVAGSSFCLMVARDIPEHIYFVLNDPMDFDGCPKQSCLVVNASTPHARSDGTCIIPAGCHPFIAHDSFIYYARANLETASQLEIRVAKGHCRDHQPIDSALVRKMLLGMVGSPRSARDHKAYAQRVLDKMDGVA